VQGKQRGLEAAETSAIEAAAQNDVKPTKRRSLLVRLRGLTSKKTKGSSQEQHDDADGQWMSVTGPNEDENGAGAGSRAKKPPAMAPPSPDPPKPPAMRPPSESR
jgi:hypothetical protein